MSLRTRLIAAFMVLLLVAVAVVGVVATSAVRDSMTAQIDEMLVEVARRGGTGEVRGGDAPFRRTVAVVIAGPAGRILRSSPSGFEDDPDPLPDPATVPSGVTGLTQVEALDGSMSYRAIVSRGDAGVTTIWAAPLREVERAVASVAGVLLIAGLVVLVLGTGATWWGVQRGLRPVDRVVETAGAIVSGDLTRRVDVDSPDTEIGRLGAAFNEMVEHLQSALATEEAGRERLRRFVADASHELRTPIAAIAGYAELYRRGGLATDSDVSVAMQRVERESSRMHRLVEDLLALARMGEAAGEGRNPVDVAAVVREAVEAHRIIDSTRPVSLVAADPVVVTGDAERLTRLMENLLANLRSHTPEGTTALVDVAIEGPDVVITVADDGPGVDEGALPLIFERFYRADPSRSRARGGAGLGLAIVAAVADSHGGSVTAGRSSQGGLSVTVRLPAAVTG